MDRGGESSRRSDLIVISPLNEWGCSECGSGGDLLRMADQGPLCLSCADLDHLVFLPSGDAALTRRARRASSLSAVVVRFSRARRRYERQGVLVEEGGLEHAEAQCLADADIRARRRERERARHAQADLRFQAELARAILRLYPACPSERAERIAHHAGARSSGRVGRTAAGRALDPSAIELAVAAAVRHEDTDYDELLMSGMERSEARQRVSVAVDRILERWSSV